MDLSTQSQENQEQQHEPYLHTGVQPDYYISRYWGAFTSLAMARYLFRGPLFALGKWDLGSWWPSLDKGRHGTDVHSEKLYKQVENYYKNFTPEVAERHATTAFMGHDIGHETYTKQLLFEKSSGLKVPLEKFQDSVRADVRRHIFEQRYANLLGFGSMAYTLNHIRFSAKEMTRLYAETVAYETGKQPESISFSDLRHSDNTIVQNGVQKIWTYNWKRLATDLIFFGRELGHLGKWWAPLSVLKSMPFEDFGIGVKGWFLFRDIQRRHPSIFETLVKFIDKNVNPLQGMGEEITAGDIIDIYQKYAQELVPEIMFKANDTPEERNRLHRPEMEIVFGRVAELMNRTYKYKRLSKNGRENENDFALPKFLYLLGHGLVNPHKPVETLAYVEIANGYGIDAVKTLQKKLEGGMALPEALQGYPLDLSILSKANAAYAGNGQQAPVTVTTSAPGTRVQHPVTVMEPVVTPEARTLV